MAIVSVVVLQLARRTPYQAEILWLSAQPEWVFFGGTSRLNDIVNWLANAKWERSKSQDYELLSPFIAVSIKIQGKFIMCR